MPVFQYNILKVYSLCRETKDAGLVCPLIVGNARLQPDTHQFGHSLLVKKMNHGNLSVLYWSVLCTKPPFLQGKSPSRLLIHEASPCPVAVYEYLSCLGYPEEQKTLKTAWEYYNEGT